MSRKKETHKRLKYVSDEKPREKLKHFAKVQIFGSFSVKTQSG